MDEFFKTHPALASGRRSPHAQPQLSDAEVLTLALLQGVLAVATLNQTSRRVARHWRAAFPCLPPSPQWRARRPQGGPQVGRVLASPGSHAATAARLSLSDSKPLPLCAPIRHGRVRRLRDEGASFGKTSTGGGLGFKLPLWRHSDGRVLNSILPPGNSDDREPAPALVELGGGGVTLGDLGARGPECATSLAEDAGMLLITRDRAPAQKFLLSQVRQGVATTFSQLWRQFVDRVFSRSWRGLWNTIQLKVLCYNLVHAGVVSV